MNKTFIKVYWIILVVYAFVHFIFFRSTLDEFNALIRLEGEPFVFAIFNLLGLFPFAFLLVSIKFEEQRSVFKSILLSFGFISGAFAIYPAFFVQSQPKKTHRQLRWIKMAVIAGSIFSFILILYGIILGDFMTFLSLFYNDSFVHIMAIDFVFLYVLSLYIAKKYTKNWYYTCIPVLGFYFSIFDTILELDQVKHQSSSISSNEKAS